MTRPGSDKNQGGIKEPPTNDECKFFTDPGVKITTGQIRSDNLFKCLVLPAKPEETGLAEILPLLVNTERSLEMWPGNDTHTTTRFTFHLPKLTHATLTVRRITIGGSFFGSEANGYLDAEAEACVENDQMILWPSF